MPVSAAQLWTEVTTSEHAHERAALHFVRERFPDREPFRAWTNFMFIAPDGTRNEVDMLIVSPTGVYLVEIKSFPGRIDGDAGTWVWTSPEGRRRTYDNPLLLAETKAKKLKSLLLSQPAFRSARTRSQGFYLKAIVFLSSPDLVVGLNEAGATDAYGPDQATPDAKQANDLPGIIRLFNRIDPRRGRVVDRPLSGAIAEAMNQAGIRESTTHRKVGNYELGELIGEGEGWQDFAADHPHAEGADRRIRVYLAGAAFTEDERDALGRAVQREVRFLQGINHPGIERPLELLDTPRGPALVFERDRTARRLDHWLADDADTIDLMERIDLVRDLGETLRYAHRQGLYHRALAPQHIIVSRLEGRPVLKIRDWQTAARRLSSTISAASGTRHIMARVSEATHVYLAPETLQIPDPQPTPADIWSLGAVSFLILSGRPPAADLDGLHEHLREQGYLSLASSMDAPAAALDKIIRHATMVDATERFVSVDEFLAFLDEALDELTRPEDRQQLDPLDAARNDVIADTWTVVKRVGSGSTSVVLLARTEERQEVLKVARDEEHARRVRDEYEILRDLRDRTIIATYGLEEKETAGRTMLRLEAAEGTLAHELREHGAISLDLLERWGGDLLNALVFIDDEGVAHRDIKPENLGIVERGKEKKRHLVLFDFSLSRTDPSEIRVGTAGYLDPFLEERKPRRWDEQAERYAAAVTLYEMATGTRPQWGDGSTDPALTDLEVPTIQSSLFDPAVRDGLVEFFERGLHRDPKRRFDTALEMRHAWTQIFADAERRAITTDEGLGAADVILIDVNRSTPIVDLGLAARIRNAIQRLEVTTVGDLADIPAGDLVRLSGIGAATRREISHLAQRIRAQLADAGAGARGPTASVDRLADQLVPRPPADEDNRTAVSVFLGLASGEEARWPTHRQVMELTGLDPETISDALASARTRWGKRTDLTEVRRELVERLVRRAGVAGVDELAGLLLASRGSLASEPRRSRHARAVVRAAVEAESTLQKPRLLQRRIDEVLLVALDGEVAAEDGPRTWVADPLFDAAAALGERAEQLIKTVPLLAADQVVRELRGVDLPDGVGPLGDARLVRLAAAASPGVSVSTRLELYPTGMEASRAIEESRAVLLDRRGLRPDDVRMRVAARFPDAAAIPGRPGLDRLVEPYGLTWDEPGSRYMLPPPGRLLSSTVTTSRGGTSFGTPDERETAVRDMDHRLAALTASGGFLALTVDARRLGEAAARVAARTDAARLDLDRLLIDEMRRIIDATPKARWEKVLESDAKRGERAWSLLQQLVDRALPAVEERLYATDGVAVVTGLGLLARYDRFAVLERLRHTLTRGADVSSLRGAMLIVPGDDPTARPAVDGRLVPVITANQWAHLPSAWLMRITEGEAA